MYFKAAFNRGELLVCGGRSNAAEYELGAQGPAGGDLPLFGHGLVDDGVVVLQVGSDAGGGEGGPHRVLVHGVGMFGPHGEVGGVGGELLL